MSASAIDVIYDQREAEIARGFAQSRTVAIVPPSAIDVAWLCPHAPKTRPLLAVIGSAEDIQELRKRLRAAKEE